MSDPENINDVIKSLREQVESNPTDWVSRRLLEMAENTRNPPQIELSRQPEIEDEDPEDAGCYGECDVALEVLLEFFPNAEPYRLTKDDSDCAHTFLMYEGEPMDIRGKTTIDELRARFNDDSLQPQPVTLEQIRLYFRNHRTSEECRRYRELFRKHIAANLGKVFPFPP